MHRHVRHLVNTRQIEFLIHDLELSLFQGICTASIITEPTIQQSLHYGEKLQESVFSRQCELKWQPPLYHVHISSAKTPQNSR